VNRTQVMRLDSRATAAIRSVHPAAFSRIYPSRAATSGSSPRSGPPAACSTYYPAGPNVDAVVAVADGVIVGHAMATDRAEAQTFEDPCGARVTRSAWLSPTPGSAEGWARR
jgi:hypothetical protein